MDKLIFNEINLPIELLTERPNSSGLLSFLTSHGDIFFSRKLGTDTGYIGTGIWRLDPDSQKIIKVHGSNIAWDNFYETANGNLFVSGGSSILRWDKLLGEFVSAYSGYSGWSQWFETKNGNLFVASTSSNTGILQLNLSTLEFTRIQTSGYNWMYWYESKSGMVFVSSSSTSGILKWNGINAFQSVYSSGTYWSTTFEDSSGNIFMSSTSSSSLGILKWNYTSFTSAIATGYNWLHWFETKSKKVFVSSTVSTIKGIYKYDGTTFVQITDLSYYWSCWYESTDGHVYASSYQSTTLLEYIDDIFVSLGSFSYELRGWYEDTKGNLFVAGRTSPRIFKRDGNKFIDVSTGTTDGFIQKFFESSDGKLFAYGALNGSSIESSYHIAKWDGTKFVSLYMQTQGIDYIQETTEGHIEIYGRGLTSKLRYYDSKLKYWQDKFPEGFYSINMEYGGVPLVNGAIILADSSNWSRIYQGNESVLLTTTYSTPITKNNVTYAMSYSKLLYINESR